MRIIFIQDKKDKVENLILLIHLMLLISSQKCTLIGIQCVLGYYMILWKILILLRKIFHTILILK